jgi:acyl carrier protein
MSERDVIEAVHQRWCEVLDASSVGGQDDFFLSGGNSLLAVRLTGALRDDLGVRIPISAIFEARELGSYTTRVQTLCRAGGPGGPDR